MVTVKEMYKLFYENKLQPLTMDAVKNLIGKKIKTIYFGYEGQDGVDEFTVGSIVSEYDFARTQPCKGYNNRAEYWDSFMTKEQLKYFHEKLQIITADGRNTYIFFDPNFADDEDKTFYCSDSDRFVLFTEE